MVKLWRIQIIPEIVNNKTGCLFHVLENIKVAFYRKSKINREVRNFPLEICAYYASQISYAGNRACLPPFYADDPTCLPKFVFGRRDHQHKMLVGRRDHQYKMLAIGSNLSSHEITSVLLQKCWQASRISNRKR